MMNQSTQKENLHPAGCVCMVCMKDVRKNGTPEEVKKAEDVLRKTVKPEYHQSIGL